jgi:hypothetical protein
MGFRRKIGLLAVAASLVVLLTGAAPASATFHLIKIREVSAGLTGTPNSSYLEVQMYAPGQNFLSAPPGAGLARCNADCTTAAAFGIASDVASGANQSTIVIGDTGLPAGSKDFDRPLSLDSLLTGGAICYIGGPGFNDCVSWGAFNAAGNAYLMTTYGTTAGTPMAPLATGSASNRNITPGCSTLLEASDDTDNSLADFTVGTPNPRPNSVAPTETPCAPPSGGGGTTTAPGNPTSPINPAGNVRKRKCKKSNRSATVAKKKKCKKKKR